MPVPDGYTWQDFISQVRSKLRITGVSEVYLASVSDPTPVALGRTEDPVPRLCRVRASAAVLDEAAWTNASGLGGHDRGGLALVRALERAGKAG